MRQNAIRVATEEHEAMLDEIHRRKVLEHEEDAEDASSEDLRSLMLFGETRLGLPYSLWALPDQSGLPGCLVWSVGHWRTPV